MKEKDRSGLHMMIVGSTIIILCLGLSYGYLFYNNINFSYDSLNNIFNTILPIFVLFVIAFLGGIITLIGLVLHVIRQEKKELTW